MQNVEIKKKQPRNVFLPKKWTIFILNFPPKKCFAQNFRSASRFSFSSGFQRLIFTDLRGRGLNSGRDGLSNDAWRPRMTVGNPTARIRHIQTWVPAAVSSGNEIRKIKVSL